ncbi:hypothetical protein NG798_20600 [Ancylothrix sp. C2]|nr:hypothetical protein [Ancylothrix sp. D3o]
MQQELDDIFGRKVDLIVREAIESSPNGIRRSEILKTARVIYAHYPAISLQKKPAIGGLVFRSNLRE